MVYSVDDLEAWVEAKFEVLRPIDKSGDICAVCPFCGGEDSKFAINVIKGKYNCWSGSCGARGRTLDKLFEKVGPPNTEYTLESEWSPPSPPEIKTQVPTEDPVLRKEVYLDTYWKHFKPLSELGFSATSLALKAFFQKRHIPYPRALKCDIRICETSFPEESEYGKVNGYLGLPYLDAQGFPMYFQYRISPIREGSMHPDKLKIFKWRFPKWIDGFDKTQFLYQTCPSSSKPVIILTEAILDAIRVGEFGVAIGGSYLSDRQLTIIQSLSPRRIFVLMDGDLAGRTATFGKTSGKYHSDGIADVLRKFLSCPILVPPQSYFTREVDPDELSDSELIHLMQSCREFNLIT